MKCIRERRLIHKLCVRDIFPNGSRGEAFGEDSLTGMSMSAVRPGASDVRSFVGSANAVFCPDRNYSGYGNL